MAKATRKIVLKKKSTKEQKKSTKDQKKSVTTTPKNTEKNVQAAESKNVQAEVEKQAQKIIWDVGGSVISKPQGRIRFEAQVAPIPMFMLPADIRIYLQSHWLSSDVYKRDKEWLEKHNVDMDMVDKLKKFLTERL